MLNKELTKKSKYLSKLLRHSPEKANLNMNAEGWVSIRQLLLNTKLTSEELEEIVNNDDKQRYEFNEDKLKIRARQGHSVQVDLGYKPEVPPEYLYHGTAKQYFYDIWIGGLYKMNRHHVHLSPDEETALKVGQRHGKPIILEIQALMMHDDGYKFYKTENNVWLVENVPRKYLSALTDKLVIQFENEQ